MLVRRLKSLLERALPAILLLFLALPSFAQSIQLSPEQQRMLNQLPPAQRQQAMDAMRQLEGAQGDTRSTPLRESASDASPDLSPTLIRIEETAEVPEAGLLRSFGYDLFDSNEAGFDPPMTGPVPADYVLGPGDTVRVQLFGNVNSTYEYDVSRDGILNLPELGPINVTGIQFSEFRTDITRRVNEMLIGTQASVTMGQLKAIRIFVLGDANRPGSFVVGGLATISSALYRSGGISPVGSMRNIQLKRRGRTVTTLDLYDLLLQGDTSKDRRLQSGDVIFVPTIGNVIAVSGAVKRPARYELEKGASIADAVEIAGGLTPDAFGQGARLQRIDNDRQRKTVSIDLSSSADVRGDVRAGDSLIVPRVLEKLEDTVVLSGHVHRPGNYQWYPGMSITDLIPSLDELQPDVDTSYVLIRREQESNEAVIVFSINLAEALRAPGGTYDVRLQSRDTVHVFGRAAGRQEIVQSLLAELRLYSARDNPIPQVQIVGDVRAPGLYPLEAEMHISDLIRAGGGLSEAAYGIEAELTRYSVGGNSDRQIDVIKVDLDAVLRGDRSADLLLRGHDYLIINRIPNWGSTSTVAVDGEVRFPGRYRVRRGETLAKVIERAGGFTDKAFVEGAIFLREFLRQQEQEQIEMLTQRLEADIASLSLQSDLDRPSETLATGQVLLDQLRETKAVGRLVIDLQQAGGAAEGLEMRDGDRLLIPHLTQVVTVLGETQQNTSHLYQENLSRDEYINLSGGMTRRADKKLIYIVRANGAVIAQDRSRWLGRGKRYKIRPGDTIVVPLDTYRVRPLTFWANVTQILYQGAIALAAVKTFNN